MNNHPVFIGGAGRSGTTLLRVILDSHPHIACGPELKILPQISAWWHACQTQFAPLLHNYEMTDHDVNAMFATIIKTILDKHRLHHGKQRSAEKSPNNVQAFFALHKMFPQSPFIQVIRDGRDVIASLLTMDWKTAEGKPVPYTRDVVAAAQYWLHCVQSGRRFRDSLPTDQKTYMEIHYEAIIGDPENSLRGLFDFLGEPWDACVLDYHLQPRNLADESSAIQVSQPLYNAALHRWQHDLTQQQKQQIKPVIGAALIELGYAENTDW
jgi:hypothetical protein